MREAFNPYLPKCIEKDCPYAGYSDTKKCWYHSRGEALPDPIIEPGITVTKENSLPMTYTQALEEYESY